MYIVVIGSLYNSCDLVGSTIHPIVELYSLSYPDTITLLQPIVTGVWGTVLDSNTIIHGLL